MGRYIIRRSLFAIPTLIAISLIATTVGSYSFVKYSNKGFAYGLSSSQTYFKIGRASCRERV